MNIIVKIDGKKYKMGHYDPVKLKEGANSLRFILSLCDLLEVEGLQQVELDQEDQLAVQYFVERLVSPHRRIEIEGVGEDLEVLRLVRDEIASWEVRE